MLQDASGEEFSFPLAREIRLGAIFSRKPTVRSARSSLARRTALAPLPTTSTLLHRLALSAATASRPRFVCSVKVARRAPFHTTPSFAKRRFDKLPELEMDVQALSQRLSTLGVSSSSSAPAALLSTYFFTPKSGSKHPDNAEQDLKLVVVALEDAKNVGPAKILAAQVGLKDMRAVSGADLEKLLGRTRDQGTYTLAGPTRVVKVESLVRAARTGMREGSGRTPIERLAALLHNLCCPIPNCAQLTRRQTSSQPRRSRSRPLSPLRLLSSPPTRSRPLRPSRSRRPLTRLPPSSSPPPTSERSSTSSSRRAPPSRRPNSPSRAPNPPLPPPPLLPLRLPPSRPTRMLRPPLRLVRPNSRVRPVSSSD